MNEFDAASRELDWEDEIQYVNSPFQVLPEGDYIFMVKKFERAWHSGSEKIPHCKKAVLTLVVSNGDVQGKVQTTLFLHTNFMWKLGQFFVAISQCKRGETIRPNWGAVPGSGGVCHVGVRKWMGNDGKERESNEITEFYDPENAPSVSQPPAQSWSELPQGTPTPWSSGNF